ncbi:MAG: FAD-dependent monooxygenase [Nakamurella sp.]
MSTTSTDIPTEVDVLVVGAGPVGLSAACALLQSGLRLLVVDEQPSVHHTSRAAVVHPRTLEALATIDVAETVVGRAHCINTFEVRDRDRTLFQLMFDDLPSPYSFIAMIPQDVTEQILVERLETLGGSVFRGVAVRSLTDGPDAASVLVEPVGTPGAVVEVRARYVIGADGVHSTVRSCAGIDAGTADAAAESFLLADVTVSEQARTALPDDRVLLFLDRAGILVSAPLPDGSHRIVAATDRAPTAPYADDVSRLLTDRVPGISACPVRAVGWGSRFRVQHGVAASLHRGHVLLAGDAAHVHSPAGGQGMNLGIRDAIGAAAAIQDALAGNPGALEVWATEHRRLAVHVVGLATRLTRVATLRRGRGMRTVLLTLIGRSARFRRRLALDLAGLADR